MERGKIRSIAELAAAGPPRLFAEAEEEIMEAIARVTSEVQHHGDGEADAACGIFPDFLSTC